MKLNLSDKVTRQQVFDHLESQLEAANFSIDSSDQSRPWGGFFVISEEQSEIFIKTFFFDVPENEVRISKKLSPKILLVEPGKRLSWQYHHRRAEIWKVISGPVSVSISESDKEEAPQIKAANEIIVLKQGQRHRLIGNNDWGVIAEIWQHTDDHFPSDETDIVRVQDDFGR